MSPKEEVYPPIEESVGRAANSHANPGRAVGGSLKNEMCEMENLRWH